MTEMTPEMEDLRRIAGHLVDIEEGGYARRVDRALRAWEADRSRIEELERERDHYRGNVDRWAEELAARDTRIEALEKKIAVKESNAIIDDLGGF